MAHLKTKHSKVKQTDASCLKHAGEGEGLAYTGVANARRTVSSLVAAAGNVVCVVTVGRREHGKRVGSWNYG